MVLSSDYVKRNFNEIKEHSYNYLFLNVKSLNEQTETIERTVEVLGLLNEVNRIKQLCKELNSKVELDDSILYDVIKAIYNNEFLDDTQLVNYIKLKVQLMEIYDVMYSFAEIGCSLCSLTEYFIFGFTFKEQEKLSRENAFKLEEEFNDAFYNNYTELSAKTICEKQKEVILKYKNIEVKKSA